MTDLTEDMLMSAVTKAEQDLLERRKMEYEVWSSSNLFYFYNFLNNLKICFSWRC